MKVDETSCDCGKSHWQKQTFKCLRRWVGKEEGKYMKKENMNYVWQTMMNECIDMEDQTRHAYHIGLSGFSWFYCKGFEQSLMGTRGWT